MQPFRDPPQPGNRDNKSTNMPPPSVTSSPASTEGPISEADGLWNNRAIPRPWKHCPADIPDLWKQWWYRPVCGGAHSRIRYAFAKSMWYKNSGPLPYETFVDYQSRYDFMSPDQKELLRPDWEEFQSSYEPWAAVNGDMYTLATPFSGDDNRLMRELHDRGVKGTSIHEYFHQRSQKECRVQYFILVADNWGQRQNGGAKEIRAWDNNWKATHTVERKVDWQEDEISLLRGLFSYGVTFYAIAEEFQTRTSGACKQRKGMLKLTKRTSRPAEEASGPAGEASTRAEETSTSAEETSTSGDETSTSGDETSTSAQGLLRTPGISLDFQIDDYRHTVVSPTTKRAARQHTIEHKPTDEEALAARLQAQAMPSASRGGSRGSSSQPRGHQTAPQPPRGSSTRSQGRGAAPVTSGGSSSQSAAARASSSHPRGQNSGRRSS